MDKQLHSEDQILAYLENDLSSQDKAAFESTLENSQELQEMLKDYQLMYSDLSDWPAEQPPAALKNNVDQLITEHSNKSSSKTKKDFKLRNLLISLISIVLIGLVGYMIFDNHKSNQAMQEQMFAMNENVRNLLQNESSSHRIKALRISAELPQLNTELVSVLVDALKNDRSSNVRLSALETLEKHIDNDIVRTEIYRAMGNEKDPIVLMTYISILKNRNDASSIDQLKKITENEGAEVFVKDQAMMSLFQLQEY